MSEHKYKPLTAEEQESLAWDILGGRVFGTWQVPEQDAHLIASIFLPLIFASEDQRQWMKDNSIIHVFEYISEAGPRNINGYPCFFSAHYLNDVDTKAVQARFNEIKALRDKRMADSKE